jgi:hypothetical protein
MNEVEKSIRDASLSRYRIVAGDIVALLGRFDDSECTGILELVRVELLLEKAQQVRVANQS